LSESASETVAERSESETLGFQAEVRQLLQLMIHSLYSNKEIFLRELVSNASDATDKLRFAALETPELMEGDSELQITVTHSAKEKTLSITDNGIGMSRDELIDNLGTIARSGTAEFLQQMTGDQQQDAQLIGQFGVGFYSAFIVADKVAVESRRAGLDASEAVLWESDGQGEFTVQRTERATRGTTVTLHLKEAETEFLESFRLESLIRKYSDHIAFPVLLVDADAEEGDDADPKAVNSATALWTRPRTEVSDDEYKEFYKHLSHDFSDPLTWSHNRVEGKREYTSLLYIPGSAPFDLWNRDAPRGLKLYVQRVFIMDDAEQFLPLYLRFAKGVVDSSDLPLNVSRELLQNNPELQAMRSALTRRVLDMLSKMASNSADDYQKFWAEFGATIKEGVVEDRPNADKLLKLLRFTTTESEADEQTQSLADYLSRAKGDQDKIYYLVGENLAMLRASPHLEQLRAQGLEVLLLHDRIDPWMVESLTEFEGKSFQDVGKGKLDLPAEDGDGEITQDVDEKEHKPFLKKLSQTLKDKVETVNVSRRLVDSPACIITAEQDMSPQIRRMLEASGQEVPDSKPILEINVSHPLLKKLSDEDDESRFDELANIVLDQALLMEGESIENPALYVQRVNRMLVADK